MPRLLTRTAVVVLDRRAGSTFTSSARTVSARLDPSLAQAHASLAYIKFYFDWDWEGLVWNFCAQSRWPK
jgi:hypothetical protein